jgi:succinate dehydrogenase/fumarate reductase flavoprotein subunit
MGSGAGGCDAAIAGHDQRFSVLLVEKLPWIGGVTAQSGGIL